MRELVAMGSAGVGLFWSRGRRKNPAKPAKAKRVRAASTRDLEIAHAYQTGATLAELGSKFGVTRARIQQILKKFDLSAKDGGSRVRSVAKQAALLRAIEQRKQADHEAYVAKHGMSRAEAQATGMLVRYQSQLSNAKKRGIEWQFNFAQWYAVWVDSGKLHLRSRNGYVMARHGDVGPYAPHNVKIITASENVKEYQRLKQARRSK